MSLSQPKHHEINYIEISTTGMEKIKTFYAKAFGWEYNDYSPGYTGIKMGDGEIGGFSLVEEVKTGGPLVILYSDKLEETLVLVKQAGGEIVQDIFDFPGGRRFQFKDPSGNELGVWSKQDS